MAHSISLPDELYKTAYIEAKREHRTVPMQLAYWAKKARALQLSLDNPWLDLKNAELLLESSEQAAKGEDLIEIEDLDAYFQSGGKKGYRVLEEQKR